MTTAGLLCVRCGRKGTLREESMPIVAQDVKLLQAENGQWSCDGYTNRTETGGYVTGEDGEELDELACRACGFRKAGSFYAIFSQVKGQPQEILDRFFPDEPAAKERLA